MLTPDEVKLIPGEAGLTPSAAGLILGEAKLIHSAGVLTPDAVRLTHAPACFPTAKHLLPKPNALSLDLAIYYILFAGALR